MIFASCRSFNSGDSGEGINARGTAAAAATPLVLSPLLLVCPAATAAAVAELLDIVTAKSGRAPKNPTLISNEVAYRGLGLFSPLTLCLSYLVLGCWKEQGLDGR